MNRSRSLWLPLLGTILLLGLSLANCASPKPNTPASLSVHFIDVGQGDSILIDIGETEVLIDGGEKNPGVVDYIRNYVDGPLEVMVATHPHDDHIDGLMAVLDRFKVNDVWLNGEESTSRTFLDFMNSINSKKAATHTAERGKSIQAGVLNFTILNPVKPLTSDTNNNSIVLSLRYSAVGFLFMGDAGREAEASMLNLVSKTEVLKVGHHGSGSASSPEFLNIVRPAVAIYMARVGNQYGHPHSETISALNKVGARVYGTDTSGTIRIVTDGKPYSVLTAK